MKALSILQPYASLIAEEAKRIETRSWAAPASVIGTRIAICAGKSNRELEVLFNNGIVDALEGAVPGGAAGMMGRCPLGVVVATARLARCAEMRPAGIRELLARNSREFTLGYYTPGRWAWVLADVAKLEEPVPVRGMQKVFTLPIDVTEQVLADSSQERFRG